MNKKEALNSLLAVVLGLIAGAILMFAIGSNAVEGYSYLFRGALINFKRFGDTLATATPYSSCLSQLYGLVHLIYQKLWKNKREFFDRYIEEEQVMNWATGRTRPEIIRYKDIGKLRKQLEPFSFFYYPPTKINYIEHKARFDSYAEYDELCKGLLEEKDLKK